MNKEFYFDWTYPEFYPDDSELERDYRIISKEEMIEEINVEINISFPEPTALKIPWKRLLKTLKENIIVLFAKDIFLAFFVAVLIFYTSCHHESKCIFICIFCI